MPGSNSDIVTVDGDRAFVIRVSEHKAGAVKPLAEVKAQGDLISLSTTKQNGRPNSILKNCWWR
ncbi:hypothetical protein ACNKHQ_02225 [Shigella flexneri]